MAKLTNAQLAAQLEASHVSYEALAAQNASILAQIHALQAQKTAEPAAKVGSKSTYLPKSDCFCAKCQGTGLYGQDGHCFQCEGKGVQTDADQRRNYGYRRYHAAPVAAAAIAKAARPAYVPAEPTADVLERREAMARAKAAAMAGNCVVTV